MDATAYSKILQPPLKRTQEAVDIMYSNVTDENLMVPVLRTAPVYSRSAWYMSKFLNKVNYILRIVEIAR